MWLSRLCRSRCRVACCWLRQAFVLLHWVFRLATDVDKRERERERERHTHTHTDRDREGGGWGVCALVVPLLCVAGLYQTTCSCVMFDSLRLNFVCMCHGLIECRVQNGVKDQSRPAKKSTSANQNPRARTSVRVSGRVRSDLYFF